MQFFYMIVSMVKGLFFFFVLSVLVSCSFWRKVSPPIQTVHFKEDNKYQNAAEKSFQKAFSNYLSKEYNEALSEFHDFQKKYAASPRFHESIYYEARSFEKLKKYVQATQRYRDLSTMGKVHPDLTARIMYRLSF